MDNTLIRTERCPQCGAEMIWTQNAWPPGSETEAAYRCHSGHVVDPATTRQCPECGVHDTRLTEKADGREHYRCQRCGASFQIPR
jgi:predicted RNA-binding Zn-ribbon protein involved in translation (DUF1610 family)